MKIKNKTERGFTLIEILVVIGIIAVLAAIVIIAINPAKQFAQARNTQRTANVNAILNAVGQRIADNKGVFAGTFTINAVAYTCPTLPVANANIFADATGVPADINLACLVPTYIPSLPEDPSDATAMGDIGYEIRQDVVGRITVSALAAATETAIPDAAVISVTR